jgi:hypothetical protein
MTEESATHFEGRHLEVPDRRLYDLEFEHISGRNGTDERIIPLVAAFNARGLVTWGSCEGHPDTFPGGLWYPWVYFGVRPDPMVAPSTNYRALEVHRRDADELETALHELVRAFYDVAGYPADEVIAVVQPLGPWGYQALLPSGFAAGGDAHRTIGYHLGLEGRTDLHRRAWREFSLLTEWLTTGAISQERGEAGPPPEAAQRVRPVGRDSLTPWGPTDEEIETSIVAAAEADEPRARQIIGGGASE